MGTMQKVAVAQTPNTDGRARLRQQIGHGRRYEYGMFRQTIPDGWQREQPDNRLRHPDPWQERDLGIHALLFDLNGSSSAPRAAPAPPERRLPRGASGLLPNSSRSALSATRWLLLTCEETHRMLPHRHGPCFGGCR